MNSRIINIILVVFAVALASLMIITILGDMMAANTQVQGQPQGQQQQGNRILQLLIQQGQQQQEELNRIDLMLQQIQRQLQDLTEIVSNISAVNSFR